jgi:S1-C subfamily serine protease
MEERNDEQPEGAQLQKPQFHAQVPESHIPESQTPESQVPDSESQVPESQVPDSESHIPESQTPEAEGDDIATVTPGPPGLTAGPGDPRAFWAAGADWAPGANDKGSPTNQFGPYEVSDGTQTEYALGGYGPEAYPPGAYGPAGSGPAGPTRAGRGRRALAVVALALAVLSAAGGAGIAYLSRTTPGSSAGLAASPAGHTLTTAQIAAVVDPAVVDINTNLGEGTGMIATSDGEIITNNHVIDGASTIKVSIYKGHTYTATVVGTDVIADVAVLQLKGVSGLPTVTFGTSSQISIGNAVVAIGNAGGQGFPSTVTAGAITALGRTIVASGESGATETLTDVIQMDAVIEPGNSGGPLVDSSGEVVGMDTAAASTDGATPIGFALPINRVVQVANDIEHGKAAKGIVIGSVAYLGVAGQTVSRDASEPATGVGLEFVGQGTPAALAGIQEGDVIVAFDGHATATLSELADLIHKLRPGDRATVTFDNLTGGTQSVTVTLAAAPPT